MYLAIFLQEYECSESMDGQRIDYADYGHFDFSTGKPDHCWNLLKVL